MLGILYSNSLGKTVNFCDLLRKGLGGGGGENVNICLRSCQKRKKQDWVASCLENSKHPTQQCCDAVTSYGFLPIYGISACYHF